MKSYFLKQIFDLADAVEPVALCRSSKDHELGHIIFTKVLFLDHARKSDEPHLLIIEGLLSYLNELELSNRYNTYRYSIPPPVIDRKPGHRKCIGRHNLTESDRNFLRPFAFLDSSQFLNKEMIINIIAKKQ